MTTKILETEVKKQESEETRNPENLESIGTSFHLVTTKEKLLSMGFAYYDNMGTFKVGSRTTEFWQGAAYKQINEKLVIFISEDGNLFDYYTPRKN